jgi:LacI family transcriptional regulator
MDELKGFTERKTLPTMSDVARRAGVSLKSVSRVVNNEAHVTSKLRLKIETAIAELNYVPDQAARALAGARSFTIGLLFDNPSPNYIMNAIKGAYNACQTHGYHLRFDTIDTAGSSTSLLHQLETVVCHGRCDGFVLTPPLTDNPEVLEFLEARRINYVRVAPSIDKGRSSSVFIDDATAAGQVAKYLVDLGHKVIGLINGPPEHGAAGKRRSGFIKSLKASCSDVVIHETCGNFLFESGIAAGSALISCAPRPTAVFATNDDMAAGLLVACMQAGLAVPDDVSIVGFDDSWIASTVWPGLTTVHQPIERMASEAVKLLLDISLHGCCFEDRQLDFYLTERQSCGAPSRGSSATRLDSKEAQ